LQHTEHRWNHFKRFVLEIQLITSLNRNLTYCYQHSIFFDDYHSLFLFVYAKITQTLNADVSIGRA